MPLLTFIWDIGLRALYTFLYYLILPFLLLRLFVKARRNKAYRKGIAQRFGRYHFTLDASIWIHAVSVGEAIAAIPLILQIQNEYPDTPILVTTMTPTGAARIKESLQGSVYHAYLPYDVPIFIKSFFSKMNPRILLIMETELWPNLIHMAKRYQIPVCLLNARLSQKSLQGYLRIKPLIRKILGNIQIIAAQSEADLKRFKEMGAENIVKSGNIKFDQAIPEKVNQIYEGLKDCLGGNRFIWVAASTHEREEEIVLKVHQMICQEDSSALLILVPRHPERFNQVYEIASRNFKVMRRTQNLTCDIDTQVYLADTMGELLSFYKISEMAFVGGSLVKLGGHNLLEPAHFKKPILTGPHLFNFEEIRLLLQKADALTIVQNENELYENVKRLKHSANLRLQMGSRAWQVLNENQGALQRQMNLIKPYL